MQAFLATILLWAANFAPSGWALCNGQLLSISQNAALFSLIGTYYGGDGVTTFGLPDFRGRVPVGVGQGPGLSPYVQGQTGGSENVTLLVNQMPQHTHVLSLTLNVSGAQAANATPVATNSLAAMNDPDSGDNINGYGTAAPNIALNSSSVTGQAAFTGGNLPHNNVQPYLAVSYIIALQGIFPSRG